MINKINNLCDEFYEKIVDIRHKIQKVNIQVKQY